MRFKIKTLYLIKSQTTNKTFFRQQLVKCKTIKVKGITTNYVSYNVKTWKMNLAEIRRIESVNGFHRNVSVLGAESDFPQLKRRKEFFIKSVFKQFRKAHFWKEEQSFFIFFKISFSTANNTKNNKPTWSILTLFPLELLTNSFPPLECLKSI